MSLVRSIPLGRKTLAWLALGLVVLGSAPYGARAYRRHCQRVAARAAGAVAAPAPLTETVTAVASAQAPLAEKVAEAPSAQAPLAEKVPEEPSAKDMPILGYALTRNGRDYVAYLRWFSVRFPTAGDQAISECRVRFSLEQPGPAAFALRPLGKPAGDVPPGSPRCHLLPLPRPAPTKARVYLPEEQPVGIGDVDGCKADYNDQGCFINGELQLHAAEANRLHAQVWLSWTGTRGDDLDSDEGQYRLSLEPIADRAQLRVFTTGNRSGGQTPHWVKNLELLDELTKPRYRTATLSEVSSLAPDERKVTVFLRHDMDLTMYGSLQMAEYEQRRGLRWSYLLNMASSIYGVQARNGRFKVDPHALENLHHIKQLGHEIGYQNDGVAQVVEFNTPIVSWMAHEIGKLRRSGLPLTSHVPNGTPYAEKHGLWNGYLFAEFRKGGSLCPRGCTLQNGAGGMVRVQRDGKEVVYPLPPIHAQDAGFSAAGGYFPKSLLTSVGFASYSDCECTLDQLIANLRAEPPGQVVQLMTHDCRCTSWDPVMDFLVDPAFADLY